MVSPPMQPDLCSQTYIIIYDCYHSYNLLSRKKKGFAMCMQLHRSERFSRVATHALIQADVYIFIGDSCHNYIFLSRQNVFAMGRQPALSPSPIRHMYWGRWQCPVLRRKLMVSFSHLKRWINWVAKAFWYGVDLNIQHTQTFFWVIRPTDSNRKKSHISTSEIVIRNTLFWLSIRVYDKSIDCFVLSK